MAAPRFFISYSHAEPDEIDLAHTLKAGLEAAGAEVFIDTAMLVGTDWVAEIERRLTWCDYLVALLSERAVASEMVQSEIRMAASARHVRAGLPRLLPVRVKYFGALDYELDSHLARLQYSKWESPADSARLLNEILKATQGSGLPMAPAPASAPAARSAKPLPRIDPRTLTVEGGSLPSDELLYVHRSADDVVTALAQRTGQTVILKAPKQMGKSSLLIRYLAQSQRAEPKKSVAFTDLSLLSQDDLGDYNGFLGHLATLLLQALNSAAVDDVTIAGQARMTWFVEDRLLKPVGGRVVLAIDAVDRVLGRPYQADFFTMLRNWHNMRAAKPLWRQVDLALVVSTEPYLLIDDEHRSIFNVGRTIPLEPLSLTDYGALSDACGAGLTAPQLEQLYRLLGGHPYLTRLAFYYLVSSDRIPFDELIGHATEERGPFGEHLRSMLMRLHGREQLLDGLRDVLRGRQNVPDAEAQRLIAAGVIRQDGKQLVAANELYARFFAAMVS